MSRLDSSHPTSSSHRSRLPGILSIAKRDELLAETLVRLKGDSFRNLVLVKITGNISHLFSSVFRRCTNGGTAKSDLQTATSHNQPQEERKCQGKHRFNATPSLHTFSTRGGRSGRLDAGVLQMKIDQPEQSGCRIHIPQRSTAARQPRECILARWKQQRGVSQGLEQTDTGKVQHDYS